MKKILSILTTITLLTGAAATTASALTPSNFATDITVYLNGENVYAGSDNQPCIMNDRTMVQIRPIFEKLGYTAEYNESTQTAVFYGGGHNVPISFTNDSYTVNKLSSEDGSVVESINIDVPATLYKNSFYVPLRAFCETVGSDFITIKWDNAARSVYLTSKEPIVSNPTPSYENSAQASEPKMSVDLAIELIKKAYNPQKFYDYDVVENTDTTVIIRNNDTGSTLPDEYVESYRVTYAPAGSDINKGVEDVYYVQSTSADDWANSNDDNSTVRVMDMNKNIVDFAN